MSGCRGGLHSCRSLKLFSLVLFGIMYESYDLILEWIGIILPYIGMDIEEWNILYLDPRMALSLPIKGFYNTLSCIYCSIIFALSSSPSYAHHPPPHNSSGCGELYLPSLRTSVLYQVSKRDSGLGRHTCRLQVTKNTQTY